MKKQGLTLIELLVVIAIIGILSAVSITALSSIKSSRQVKVVADEIKDKILDARSYSVTPSIGNSTDQPVTSVRITLTKKGASNAKMQIQEMNGAAQSNGGLNDTKVFPDNIDFCFDASPYTSCPTLSMSFDFSANQQGFIGQVLYPAAAPNDFSFIVKNTSGSEKYKLTINRFGLSAITNEPQ